MVVATSGGLTAYRACTVAIAHGCVCTTSIIALLSEIHVNDSVAANLAFEMTVDVANIVGASVEHAVVATLSEILSSVSAYLSGRAIVATLIGNKHTTDNFAVNDIAVVANLTIICDAIATATDVDANRLVFRTLLS